MVNVFREGLLGTGATLAARVLDPTRPTLWVVNWTDGGQPACFEKILLTGVWVGPQFPFPPRAGPFPYGLPVTPP